MFIQSPLNLTGAKENFEENDSLSSSQTLESPSGSTSSASSASESTNETVSSYRDILATSLQGINEASNSHQGSSKKLLTKRPVPNIQQRPVPNLWIVDKENADPIANELPIKKEAKMIPSKKKSSDNIKVFGIRSIANIKSKDDSLDNCSSASTGIVVEDKLLSLQPTKRSRLTSGGSSCKRKRSNQEENFSFPSALLEVVRDEDSFSGQNVVDGDVSAGIKDYFYILAMWAQLNFSRPFENISKLWYYLLL